LLEDRGLICRTS